MKLKTRARRSARSRSPASPARVAIAAAAPCVRPGAPATTSRPPIISNERDRRAEVRLDHDQRGRRDRVTMPTGFRARRASAGPPGARVGGGPDGERELRELGRLERERAEREPAPRAVDLRRDDEHHDAEAERRDEERRGEVAQSPVVEPRCGDEESRSPIRAYTALSLQERGSVALPQRGRRRGCAEDHYEAERDQGEGEEDEQALLEPGRRAAGPFTLGGSVPALLNSSPRCS